MLNGWAERKTAAGAAGVVAIWWTLQISGGAENALFNSVDFLDNNVGFSGIGALGVTVTLFAGDTIKGYTRDSSTGGTVTLGLAQKITEFDV